MCMCFSSQGHWSFWDFYLFRLFWENLIDCCCELGGSRRFEVKLFSVCCHSICWLLCFRAVILIVVVEFLEAFVAYCVGFFSSFSVFFFFLEKMKESRLGVGEFLDLAFKNIVPIYSWRSFMVVLGSARSRSYILGIVIFEEENSRLLQRFIVLRRWPIRKYSKVYYLYLD